MDIWINDFVDLVSEYSVYLVVQTTAKGLSKAVAVSNLQARLKKQQHGDI
jgi:hypothetical protein